MEDSFSKYFEINWKSNCDDFINSVFSNLEKTDQDGCVSINRESALNIISFMLMMISRNPEYDAYGVYTLIREKILDKLLQLPEAVQNEMMRAVWLLELYKLFYSKDGSYNLWLKEISNQCQMILFTPYPDCPINFITSDNPAVVYHNNATVTNENGFYFPLTPRHLVFVGKGSRHAIEKIDVRYADATTVKHINSIIYNGKHSFVVSNQHHLYI